MTTRGKHDETVPNRVLERQRLPKVEGCAKRIQRAPGKDQGRRRVGQRGEQRRQEEQPLPAEREIDDERQALEPARIPKLDLDKGPGKRRGPDPGRDAEGQTAGNKPHGQRRVCAGDHDENGGVVDPAAQIFADAGPPGIVRGGGAEHRQQAERIDQDRGESHTFHVIILAFRCR